MERTQRKIPPGSWLQEPEVFTFDFHIYSLSFSPLRVFLNGGPRNTAAILVSIQHLVTAFESHPSCGFWLNVEGERPGSLRGWWAPGTERDEGEAASVTRRRGRVVARDVLPAFLACLSGPLPCLAR